MSFRKQVIQRISRRRNAKKVENNSTNEELGHKVRIYQFPVYQNKILIWIRMNMPELVHVERLGIHFKDRLNEFGFTPAMFTRIINNKAAITLDELHLISQMLGANLHDLI